MEETQSKATYRSEGGVGFLRIQLNYECAVPLPIENETIEVISWFTAENFRKDVATAIVSELLSIGYAGIK